MIQTRLDNETVSAQIERWIAENGGLQRDALNKSLAALEAAEAEVARLREILTALAGDEPPADSDEALKVR